MTEQAPEPDFIRQQYDFAAHIRDPGKNAPPPGIEDRRLAIYRELFYNNVEGFVSSAFPVFRSLMADDHWHAMVREFFANHRCETPLFAEIAQEFLSYLHDERKPAPSDPPFTLELAHYEWVELAVSISNQDRDAPPTDPNGDLLAGVPVVSPLAWNLSYSFPVHRISPEYQPKAPGDNPTHLVVYRDRANEVRFLEINAVTQRLLQLLKEIPDATGLHILKLVASELGAEDPEPVIHAGTALLADLRNRNILLGTRTT